MAESFYPHATETIEMFVRMVGNNRVTDVKAVNEDECEEMYPCSGHEGVIVTFGNGSKLKYCIDIESVDIGALEVFFFPDRRTPQYKGSTHFIEYINDEYANELQKLYNKHYGKKLNGEKLNGEKEDKENKEDYGMMSGHYESSTEIIQETMKKVGSKKIVDVKAIQQESCMESYPCQGHKGAILTFEDGEILTVKCDSVDIGALEVFYLPHRKDPQYKGNRHFINMLKN